MHHILPQDHLPPMDNPIHPLDCPNYIKKKTVIFREGTKIHNSLDKEVNNSNIVEKRKMRSTSKIHNTFYSNDKSSINPSNIKLISWLVLNSWCLMLMTFRARKIEMRLNDVTLLGKQLISPRDSRSRLHSWNAWNFDRQRVAGLFAGMW